MTVEPAACSGRADRPDWRSRLAEWRSSAVLLMSVDVLVAASLPWSTTAPAIFLAMWLLLLTPTIDWTDYALCLKQPAFCRLPFCCSRLPARYGRTAAPGRIGCMPSSRSPSP